MRPPQGEILQNEYKQRVSQVMDYIHRNYGEDLNLEKLARMACLSKFHFHRVFKSVAGEPVGDFIRRVRVQEAFRRIVNFPQKSITEIALECGFSSSQNFTRMFKADRGITPSELRTQYDWRNFCKILPGLKGKKREDLSPREARVYDVFCVRRQLPLDRILHHPDVADVQVRLMPDLHVAYIRCIGPTKETMPAAYTRLFQWGVPKGYFKEGTMVLAVMWGNPDITPEDKRIVDACITVPDFVKEDHWVNVQTIPGGMYAVHHCEVASADYYEEAWNTLIFNWLIPSSYELDARPGYHRYCQSVEAHPLKHHVLDLYLPIKPLYE